MYTHTHIHLDSVNVVCICVNIYTHTCKLGPHTWYRKEVGCGNQLPKNLKKNQLDFITYIMYAIHK